MDISSLRPGDPVELLIDANAIPAGCYTFVEEHGEMSVFRIGQEVIIGLATDFWKHFMRPAQTCSTRLSTESEFAKRYGRLYARLRTKDAPLDPTRLTFCIVSPRVLKKSQGSLNQTLETINHTELLN
jgi:hypothetical protein